MPELPEMEALRTALDEALAGETIEKAGPAHVATLKTVLPPLASIEGTTIESVERRGKRLLFELASGELVLVLHLMTAGRVRLLRPGEQGPKQPAFRLRFASGLELVLTEAGAKKRAGVWLLTREQVEEELAHLGPEANEVDEAQLAEILRRESRRLHPLLRDQRALAGIGRAWSNEILHEARLSPFALSDQLDDEEVRRLHGAIAAELERGTAERKLGRPDRKVYRVHDRLDEPCHVCGSPIARVDYEEHTIYYCPACQTGGRVLKDRRLSRLLR